MNWLKNIRAKWRSLTLIGKAIDALHREDFKAAENIVHELQSVADDRYMAISFLLQGIIYLSSNEMNLAVEAYRKAISQVDESEASIGLKNSLYIRCFALGAINYIDYQRTGIDNRHKIEFERIDVDRVSRFLRKTFPLVWHPDWDKLGVK